MRFRFEQGERLEIKRALEHFVSTSSEVGNIDGNNKILSFVEAYCSFLKMETRRIENSEQGDCLIAQTTQYSSNKLLLVGRTATDSSVAQWTKSEKQIGLGTDAKYFYGPGSWDTKAGIIQILFALRELKKRNALMDCEIKLVVTPDGQETSEFCRDLISENSDDCIATVVYGLPTNSDDTTVLHNNVSNQALHDCLQRACTFQGIELKSKTSPHDHLFYDFLNPATGIMNMPKPQPHRDRYGMEGVWVDDLIAKTELSAIFIDGFYGLNSFKTPL